MCTSSHKNIDDLHERAGSSKVVHLHGEILKSRSTVDETLVYTMTKPTIEKGDLCELGSQLRPHIVWFGEAVPMIEVAAMIVAEADVLLVVGTSMGSVSGFDLGPFCFGTVPCLFD